MLLDKFIINEKVNLLIDDFSKVALLLKFNDNEEALDKLTEMEDLFETFLLDVGFSVTKGYETSAKFLEQERSK